MTECPLKFGRVSQNDGLVDFDFWLFLIPGIFDFFDFFDFLNTLTAAII
jgi:hypothetical protein